MPVVASAPAASGPDSRAIDLSRRRARSKRKTPARARGRTPIRVPWRRALMIGVALAALGGGGFLGWQAWHDGLPTRVEAALHEAHQSLRASLPFRLDEVTVEGRRYVPREAILGALGVDRGDILLTIDLDAMRQRLEQIDWIEQAAVERRLPDTLHIALRERVAVAVWQRGAQDFVLIDRNGRTVRATHPPPGFERLLLVAGEGAPQQVGELFLLLAVEPGVAGKLTAATWVGQRRWNLYLKGGIEVRLPEEDAVAALQRLAALDKSDQLLSREVAVIDLRLPDKLILRRILPEPPPDPKAAPAAGGKPAAPTSPGSKPPVAVAGRPT